MHKIPWQSVAAVITLYAATAYSPGIITTIAGTGWVFPSAPVPAVQAPLGTLWGVAYDANGNAYTTDADNSIVVRVSVGGVLTVIAGNGTHGFSGMAVPPRVRRSTRRLESP